MRILSCVHCIDLNDVSNVHNTVHIFFWTNYNHVSGWRYQSMQKPIIDSFILNWLPVLLLQLMTMLVNQLTTLQSTVHHLQLKGWLPAQYDFGGFYIPNPVVHFFLPKTVKYNKGIQWSMVASKSASQILWPKSYLAGIGNHPFEYS